MSSMCAPMCSSGSEVCVDSGSGLRRYVEAVSLERSPATLAISIRIICMRIPAYMTA